jgi:hypothetical protein
MLNFIHLANYYFIVTPKSICFHLLTICDYQSNLNKKQNIIVGLVEYINYFLMYMHSNYTYLLNNRIKWLKATKRCADEN